MAFVLAATNTFSTGLTSVSAFFLPVGHPQYSGNYINFLSGTEYFTTGNQYTVGNSLYLEDTSPKIKDVLNMYFGVFSLGSKSLAQTINFGLFTELSGIGAEGNQYVNIVDLRGNSRFRHFVGWGGGGLKSILIDNLQNMGVIDTRQSQIREINLSGTVAGSINVSDSQLSAFSMSGFITNMYAGMNLWNARYIDFKDCSVSFLTGVNILKFSRWNTFSGVNNRRLTSVNLTGPLSSIQILDLAQNELSSVKIPFLPTLRYLYLGDVGLRIEGCSPTAQDTLPANKIILNSLTGVETIELAGIGPMSGIDCITGIRELSSLRTLDISRNTQVGGINFRDLNLFEIPSKQLAFLNATDCLTLTSIKFGSHRFNTINSFINLGNAVALPSLDLSPLTGLNSLDISFCSKLNESNITWPAPTNNIYSFYCTNTDLRSFDTTQIPVNLIIFVYTGSGLLSSINLDQCTRMNFLIIQDSTIQTLGLSSLSSAQEFNFNNNDKLLNLDFNKNISLTKLRFTNHNELSSFTNTSSMSSLQELFVNNNLKLGTIDLRGLSALKTLTITSNALLSSLNTDFRFPNLTSLIWSADNPNLSTIEIKNSPLFREVEIRTNAHYLNFDNNPLLHNIYINQSSTSRLSSFNIINAPSLLGIRINPGTTFAPNTETFDSLSLTNTSLVRSIRTNSTSLTGLKFLNETPSIQELSVTNDPFINGGIVDDISETTKSALTSIVFSTVPNISNIDNINFANLTNLKSVTFSNCGLSSVNHILQNLQNKDQVTELIFISNNIGQNQGVNLSVNGYLLSSFSRLQTLNFQSNRGSYVDWDSVFYGLCANSDFGRFGSCTISTAGGTQRNTSRSRATNAEFFTLTGRFAQYGNSISAGVANTAPSVRARPTLNVSGPSSIQYTQTGAVITDARYLNRPVTTYTQVVSGPGVLVSPTIVQATSSNGTITVLLSTINDNIDPTQNNGYFTGYYASVSSYVHIPLTKLDISNSILFTGLNRVYTGGVVPASSFAVGYPSLTINNFYFYENDLTTPVSPINAGFYTVSAVIVDDLYQGTATAELSVLDPTNYYTYPASATSSTIYFNKFCDSNNDIVVSFDYACFGPELTGTEGFCVMFGDNTQFFTPISGGGAGRALGYTYLNLLSVDNGFFSFISNPERYRGVLGIGFDLAGNFGVSGLGIEGFSDRKENSICIRSQYLSSFKPYYRSENLSTSGFSLYQYNPDPIIYPVEYKSVRVRATNFGKQISVDLKKKEETEYKNYVNATLPTPLPEIVNVGLNFSTGANNPTYRIKNFNFNCFKRAVTATPFDLFNCFYLGPGVVGGGGITFTTEYSYYFFHSCSVVTGLPASMDLYVDDKFIGNVLYDSSFIGAKFALLNKDATVYETIYGNFLSGANYLYV
jgi:hypothetical protein